MSQNGNLYRHNLVLAKVNGVKQTVSSSELHRLIEAGYDVEVVSPT
jgi:hypothetical protein